MFCFSRSFTLPVLEKHTLSLLACVSVNVLKCGGGGYFSAIPLPFLAPGWFVFVCAVHRFIVESGNLWATLFVFPSVLELLMNSNVCVFVSHRNTN